MVRIMVQDRVTQRLVFGIRFELISFKYMLVIELWLRKGRGKLRVRNRIMVRGRVSVRASVRVRVCYVSMTCTCDCMCFTLELLGKYQ